MANQHLCTQLALASLLCHGVPLGCLQQEVAHEVGARCNSRGLCAPGLVCVQDRCRAEQELECLPLTVAACPEVAEVGECRAGTRRCDATAHWEPCQGQVAPVPEVCDGKDNDCDVATDEDPVGAGEPCGSDVGECRPGTVTCQAGQPVCEGEQGPVAESCDGLDNDCDDATDEDFPNLTQPCHAGQGECRRDGRFRCSPEGGAVECDVLAGEPAAEVCDGKDNDCDVATDEDPVGAGEPCGSAVGECRLGTVTCQAGQPVCEGEQGPVAESCDGLDNDCDGATDEELTSPLAGNQEGVCAGSRDFCDGAWGWQPPVWAGIAGYVSEEGLAGQRCDGLDNDCDGTTDEGFTYIQGQAALAFGAPCGMIGSCGPGQVECRNQALQCSTLPNGSAYPGTAERCDGLDNDCDGTTDEEAFGPLNREADPQDRWVEVCGGTFVMGSPGEECAAGCNCGAGEHPCQDPRCPETGCPGVEVGRSSAEQQHRVTLTRPFAIAATEVTQAQWSAMWYDGRPVHNPSHFPEPYPQDLDRDDWNLRPVEQVNWYEALAYCNWRSEQEGLPRCYKLTGCQGRPGRGMTCAVESVDDQVYDCQGYRLPTEAEWEYAARGGTHTGFWTGELQGLAHEVWPENLAAMGEYGRHYTHRVGERSIQENPWGLYSVHGNVAEWCWDWWNPDLGWGQAEDPLPRRIDDAKVVRGGSWAQNPEFCRSAARGVAAREFRAAWLGFRPVRTIGPCAPEEIEECGTSEGACQQGVRVCAPSGSWGACRGAQVPQLEVCDGLDNDCDGQADEPQRCYTGLPATDEVGACQPGTLDCSVPGETRCVGEVLPQAERCDGLDNDCDGQTDEGEPLSVNSPWIRVCPGTFIMGSPGEECAPGCTCGSGREQCQDPRCPAGCPGAEFGHTDWERQHPVTLTHAFVLAATEVTQGQWSQMTWQGVPIPNPSHHPAGEDHPVENVNWYEMLAYCNWLSEQEGLTPCYELVDCHEGPPGPEGGARYDDLECDEVRVTSETGSVYDCEGYRLPTEAEWEYATRAGTYGPLWNGALSSNDCGDDPAPDPVLDPVDWYCENVKSVGGTHQPVGRKRPNPWGLYDVHGNVGELCWDRAQGERPADHPDAPVTDPTGPDAGSFRVLRGLGLAGPVAARSAWRSGFLADRPWLTVGFRPARTLPAP